MGFFSGFVAIAILIAEAGFPGTYQVCERKVFPCTTVEVRLDGTFSYKLNNSINPVEFKGWSEWKECMLGLLQDPKVMSMGLAGKWGVIAIGVYGGMGCAVIQIPAEG